MKLFLFLYFVSVIIRSTYSEKCVSFENCECLLSNQSVINLMPITNNNNTARYVWLHIDDEKNDSITYFFYNPCFDFSLDTNFPPAKSGEKNCNNAFGCEIVVLKNGTIYQQEIISSNATSYTSSEISYFEEKTKSNLTVSLICDPKAAVPNAEIVKHENKYNLTLTSKCACIDGCINAPPSTTPGIPTTVSPKTESKLSTGSILLILFFTFLVIYVIGGILWNGYCQGASGMEMLPNIEFWRDFPALITDGARFTASCCMVGTTSYDRV